MRKTFFGVLCLLILAGCGGATGDVADPTVLISGIDRSNMDLNVRPQDDFYSYVNGTWLENTEIPADRTTTGVFRDLREDAREDVLAIIQNLAAQPDLEPGSCRRYRTSWMRSISSPTRRKCRPTSPAAG